MAFELGDEGGRSPTLVLQLRTSGRSHPASRPVPVEVEVRNQGTGDVWLAGVVDGSEQGIRYPHYRPSVVRNGLVVAEPGPPEDPLVSPLRAADFRRLGPGEAFDPTQSEGGAAYLPLATFATFSPAEPGRYRYALVLSTESARPEDWLGRFGQTPNAAPCSSWWRASPA
jgi:hypothetical protein